MLNGVGEIWVCIFLLYLFKELNVIFCLLILILPFLSKESYLIILAWGQHIIRYVKHACSCVSEQYLRKKRRYTQCQQCELGNVKTDSFTAAGAHTLVLLASQNSGCAQMTSLPVLTISKKLLLKSQHINTQFNEL